MHGKNRSRLGYKLAYAIRSPDRIAGHARRLLGRDTLLRLATRDHVSYCRAALSGFFDSIFDQTKGT